MSWLIGVDVGGTFTDFYAFEAAAGTVHLYKCPSTPDNPARAIIDGLAELCAANGIETAAVERLSHGTTVATNTLIQRRGGKVALITTEGFRDLLEVGRQTRPHMFDLQRDHPPPLVPRELRFEVMERITAGGKVVRALDAATVARAVAALRDTGADACAVCLLFSFLNADHERRIGEALAEAAPNVKVSLSSEVRPEFREYERFSTTVLNAYFQPVMERYLGDLQRHVGAALPAAALGIYQSSGGLMSIETARRFPVRTAMSGPAAGAVGAIHCARLAGRPDVISLDMGGTSADVCLIRGYDAGIGFERDIAGFPVRLPMVDINTVGAGGGSIAWFDRDGLLKVGPESAGADPGPACYGRGGTEATVTDANFVLGRLSPDGLIGGRMRLDEGAARAALAPAAERLGLGAEKTALGILGIVVATMVRAIRAVSVERGLDPRDYSLMAFGGAGALHAGDVARALGIGEILVPPAPGILCAQGLVVSELKEDFVATDRILLASAGAGAVQAHLDGLLDKAGAWFEAEGTEVPARTVRVSLDMRFVGQNFELSVPVDRPVDRQAGGAAPRLPGAQALHDLFFQVHEQHYGFHNPADPVEVINVRVTATAALPGAAADGTARGSAAPAASAHRPVHFDGEGARQTPVYDRAALAPGHVLTGPAIIEQFDATTVLHPTDRLTVDEALNLIIEVTP